MRQPQHGIQRCSTFFSGLAQRWDSKYGWPAITFKIAGCIGDQALGDMPRIVNVLPTQFNEATNEQLSWIDVFYVLRKIELLPHQSEATTSIYSVVADHQRLARVRDPDLDALSFYLVSPR